MHDLIIIGSGVAGLSAGLYAARGGIDVLLLEKGAPGGQLLLTDNIENYPGIEKTGGAELAQKMLEQVKKFGLEVKSEGAKDIELSDDHVEVKTKDNNYKAKYCIVALGSNPRKLDIPGEDKYRGKGVSYCATCDGAFFKDKDVIVIGGGDSALDEGVALTKYASKVTIVHRRDGFKADKYLQDAAKKNNKIEFLMNHEVKEIKADEDGKVDRVVMYDNEKDKEYEFDTKGVFIFIGYEPNSKLLEGKVELDSGYVVVNLNMKSSHDRLYAAGDIRKNAVKQVSSSGGDGATAAITIMHKLRSENS